MSTIRSVEHDRVEYVIDHREVARVTHEDIWRVLVCERLTISTGPLHHMCLCVDPDPANSTATAFDQDAASATHRVQESSAWPAARDIYQRPRESGGHTSWLEERPIRGTPGAKIVTGLGDEPRQKGVISREHHPEFHVGGFEIDLVPVFDEDRAKCSLYRPRIDRSSPDGSSPDRSRTVRL